jgi:hypothetical protein
MNRNHHEGIERWGLVMCMTPSRVWMRDVNADVNIVKIDHHFNLDGYKRLLHLQRGKRRQE